MWYNGSSVGQSGIDSNTKSERDIMTKSAFKPYTALQLLVLQQFFNTSYSTCGACHEEENMSYMNAEDLKDGLGLSIYVIGGIMASLVEKSAIMSMGESSRGAKINDYVICDMDFCQKALQTAVAKDAANAAARLKRADKKAAKAKAAAAATE
jgi:hypothetical protein